MYFRLLNLFLILSITLLNFVLFAEEAKREKKRKSSIE